MSPFFRTTTGRQSGFSVLELLIVSIVLAIATAIAVPRLSSTDPQRLERAAGEVADAFRFARSEAVRTGTPYGTHTEAGLNRIRVFRADTGTVPPTPVYDVYHPLSKQLYDVDLDTLPFASGIEIGTPTYTWQGTCNQPALISFAANGVPFCGDPVSVILRQAVIGVSLSNATRDVVVDGITGRVTVQ